MPIFAWSEDKQLYDFVFVAHGVPTSFFIQLSPNVEPVLLDDISELGKGSHGMQEGKVNDGL